MYVAEDVQCGAELDGQSLDVGDKQSDKQARHLDRLISVSRETTTGKIFWQVSILLVPRMPKNHSRRQKGAAADVLGRGCQAQAMPGGARR